MTIDLTSAGNVSLTSNAADAVHSLTTNADTTLNVSTGSLSIGAGSSSLGGPVKSVTTADGQTVAARAVILAMGAALPAASAEHECDACEQCVIFHRHLLLHRDRRS